MKTHTTYLNKISLIISVFLLTNISTYANHLFGGEISWQCLGNGKFQFTLKVYRDCQGIPFTPPQYIDVYGNSGLTSIPMNPALTVINDLSPANCGFDCTNPANGAVQEFIMKSNPIMLTGPPPATGWTFAYNDCCRSIMTNLGGGGQGTTIRATMFPYQGMNVDQCFDSSPFFAERPFNFLCIGHPFTYNPNAIDVDGDSLVYSWSNCIDQPTALPPAPFITSPIQYSPPYTLQSPIPGNPVLNPTTGELNFFVDTANAVIGNFASCIKVTAYRCGVKIAEIYRDCFFRLINNCFVAPAAPAINHPPVYAYPFASGTSADTTVVAGDTVRFSLSFVDLEQNLVSLTNQNVTINASGLYFGTNFTSDTSGCPSPPCATLNKTLPSASPIANMINFQWVPNCSLVNFNTCNSEHDATYYFVFNASDNYCPVPAHAYLTAKITVSGPLIQRLNDSLFVNYPSAVSYQWYFGGSPIPGATNPYYIITTPGFYSCHIETADGCVISQQPLNVTTVGVDEMSEHFSLAVVPNPGTDNITILISGLKQQSAIMELTDISGRKVMQKQIRLTEGQNRIETDTQQFARGTYILELSAKEGDKQVKVLLR